MSAARSDDEAPSHRDRLLAGMADALREDGLRGTTVADVVRQARVSRRTFYEHFDDLVDAYLALVTRTSDAILEAMSTAAAAPAATVPERLEQVLDAYLGLLGVDPALARAVGAELHLAGDRGVELQLALHERAARLFHALVEEARAEDPAIRPLPVDLSYIVTAGVHELVVRAFARQGDDDLSRRLLEVRQSAVALVQAVLTRPG